MDPLPPIPTPKSQLLREFRIQVLPVFVFIGIVVAVVFIWRGYIQPMGVVGEVESIRANASSIMDGVLVSLAVERFDTVTAGQEIGEVVTASPEFVKASLAAIQTDLLVLQARMRIDDQRREFDYQGLWFNLMEQKVDLAADKANLVQASNEYNRVSQLFQDKVDSGSSLDVAKAAMESLSAKVAEQTKLIDSLSLVVDKLRFSNETLIKDPINEAIQAKEKELEMTLKPVKLVAPIDGVVSMVFRRTGEKIIRGEPIVTISASKAEHIVGYMRQPMTQKPELNARVQVVTRGQRRLKGIGQVLHVGSAFEPMNSTTASLTGMIPNATTSIIELGLPILVSIPDELKTALRPGESVDLSIMPVAK